MRMDPDRTAMGELARASGWHIAAVVLAAIVGLGLMLDSLLQSSATYDEVAYLRVAARWWRTGDQDEISRMGSPLTFWKLQQVPVLWAVDRAGFRVVVDDPIGNQQVLLPIVRTWSLTIWLVASVVTAAWSRRLYGPRAMVLAAWLFALSPNLLAHGPLVTMELPLVACTTGMFFLFGEFLRGGRRWPFLASAALGGVAFSCKYTVILLPPILGASWWVCRWREGERGLVRLTSRVAAGMVVYGTVLVLSNLVVTGFATLPLAHASGEHPSLDGRFGRGVGRLVTRAIEMRIPQDWVGFATQMRHQRSGGSSYLFGERRMTGWWYYYFVALAVKVPLTFWLLVAARTLVGRRSSETKHDEMLPIAIGLFLVLTALGSSRNYGVRYLLPLAPLAIVWVSAVAEASGRARVLAGIALAGQALAVASVHPHELSYFNALAGGPSGGRFVLSDSNLDWGQGLKSLARLQRQRSELRDLTLFYFGDTDAKYYGLAGRCYTIDAGTRHPGLPPAFSAETTYVAVSASLQFGPWGPPDYFRSLDDVKPVAWTDDFTIAIYRAEDRIVYGARSSVPSRR